MLPQPGLRGEVEMWKPCRSRPEECNKEEGDSLMISVRSPKARKMMVSQAGSDGMRHFEVTN